MKRHLRARPCIATTPIYVSQFTAPSLFGFKNERDFLDFIREHEVPSTPEGKTILVDVDDLRVALRDMCTERANKNVASENDVESQSSDAVLAAIGFRRVGS